MDANKINQVKTASEAYMETVGKLLQVSGEVKKTKATGKAARTVQPKVAATKIYYAEKSAV